MHLGLGAVAQPCGASPCGFWDNFLQSQACANYKQCVILSQNSTPATPGSSGATYNTVSTPCGDFQVLSNGQIFDPNGALVSSVNCPSSGILPTPAPTDSTTPVDDTWMYIAAVAVLFAGLIWMNR